MLGLELGLGLDPNPISKRNPNSDCHNVSYR